MKRSTLLPLAAMLFALFSLQTPLLAADDGPLAMSDIARLVEQDQSPADILIQMNERGISFRLTSAAERRLKQWGFADDQLELVGRIAAGEKVDMDAGAPADSDAPEAGAGEEEHAVGYINPAEWHAAEKARVERAIAAAGLGYQRYELSRCTLYCNDRRARDLVPLLRRLEGELIRRFPASLVNATSPQSAHIVIVDGDSAWSNWVRAFIDSYKQDGISFNSGPAADIATIMTRGPGYMTPTLTATHADKKPNNDSVVRSAVYSVGHLIMQQAAGEEQPSGLQTGFGNLTEALAMETPSVTVYSYEERDTDEAHNWAGLIVKRFRDKLITNPYRPWTYSTDTMVLAEYAECWALVSTLAEAPDKFARVVRLVREGKTMAEAVREVYELTDQELLEAWFRYVHR